MQQTTKTQKFTRQDYLNNACTHKQYYSQFVTDFTKDVVLRKLSIERIKSAIEINDNLNSIPLATWDGMVYSIESGLRAKLKQCGDSYSLSAAVCLLKEAARQLVQQ